MVEHRTVHLQLLGFEEKLEILSLFDVQWDPIHPRCPVLEFRSVIGQDGKIVHAGDDVELSLLFMRYVLLIY